ncbi:testis-expressed protein 52-like [Haliotis rufescens]|uniref:testis-expressed protein 52-like n=1 Tax=Haliotis rufescens TaxID=6454 RepID=UPI00201EE602|nr:testis-expressed protein 52-like [Haliotis rufescens]
MSEVGVETMPTLQERERLMNTLSPHYSGFTPRPVEQLSRQRKPQSSLDIECHHFLRTKSKHFTHGNPTLEYRLWLEAGKHQPPFPERPDSSYNSNVWRNFRRHYGFDTTAEGRKMSDVIAAMYPLNIPAPSKVGDNTFHKYIMESRIFEDDKYKMMAIQRTKADVKEFKKLKIKTESRNPPLDEDGNILPPENYKRYVPRFFAPQELPPSPQVYHKTDMFGQRYVPRSRPHLYQLTYAMNHPEYDAIRKEILLRREMLEKKKEQSGPSRVIPTPTSSKYH